MAAARFDRAAGITTLHNGVRMPIIGLGTWQVEGEAARRAVSDGLAAGYRHIDTAMIYENEAEVGAALAASAIPRDQVLVTTKLWNDDHGRANVFEAFESSRTRLGLQQVDLYLIHWPVAAVRLQTWETFAEILARGDVRAIGVSNFTIDHLEELAAAGGPLPTVNQVEFSPFLFQEGLLRHCRAKGIQLVAYSPLARGQRLEDPTVQGVATEVGCTAAQVLLAWALQHQVVVIPKSITPARQRENLAAGHVRLGADAMARLDSLDEGFRLCWDPTTMA